ncbi:NADP-dependent oxidoreductase domain-containing protein, partial [Baffinella frigidus]
FGWGYSSTKIENKEAGAMLDTFFQQGYRDVDTALTYSSGKTEKILGELMPQGSERALKCGVLATKAGPWKGAGMSGNGGLAPAELRNKVELSLGSLQRSSIDLLYLHAPDVETGIEETLQELNTLHQQGNIPPPPNPFCCKFKSLGLSNFQAWEVAHIHHLCLAKGYGFKPTVYQGMYNPVTREVERELLPCLRRLGISFYAYNPLAGGILTGKHTPDADPDAGRFKNNKMYQDRFWKPAFFAAADKVKAACEAEKVDMVAATFRWMTLHSQLTEKDAVILGASSLGQLEVNLAAIKNAENLPPAVLAAFDAAWEDCSRDCPSYERGCSGSAL